MQLTVNYRLVDDRNEVDVRRELEDVEISYGLPSGYYTRVEIAKGVVEINKLKRRLREYERYDDMQGMQESICTMGQE